MRVKAVFERPWVYGFTQKLNSFTTSRIRELAKTNIPNSPRLTLLDIGCGIGSYRNVFDAVDYTGVDINPSYIESARRAHPHGTKFLVMGAGRLEFPDGTFDAILSTAMTHHLDDESLASMVGEGLRVTREGGALHVIDAILPVSRKALFKRWFFMQDRGRNQRSLEEMTNILEKHARVTKVVVLTGPLHDVAYFRVEIPRSPN
jgi:ubiquinone/menaquinone biosynthesis C-methylase UbiE